MESLASQSPWDVGFKAFKLHAWGDAKEDAKLCRNLRKWCGPDADLMFDGSAGWDYVTSMWFGRQLEDCGFLWYEEPMREFELGSYRKLCDALDIPVLASETPDGCHWNMATWIQLGALDMTRTSWFFKGGITGAMKVCHLAECFGMEVVPHNWGEIFDHAVHFHVELAMPNCIWFEMTVPQGGGDQPGRRGHDGAFHHGGVGAGRVVGLDVDLVALVPGGRRPGGKGVEVDLRPSGF